MRAKKTWFIFLKGETNLSDHGGRVVWTCMVGTTESLANSGYRDIFHCFDRIESMVCVLNKRLCAC